MDWAVQQSFDDLGAPLIEVEFVVLDFETTGGSPNDDRITEVGAVKVRGGEVVGTFHALVDPEIPIPPLITALTGISDSMVAGAEPIETILPCLLEFLGDAVFVGHNASFDWRFLQANLERHAYPRATNRVVCTARLARKLLPRDEVANVRLATLAAYLGASVTPCHRALTDARATVDVLHRLLELAGSFGVLALEDLIEFPSARADATFKKVHLADRLPHAPGVYLFRDARGRVLYVGKAKDLRTRVRSYFSGDSRAKIADLLRELAAIDHVPCATEFEASVREVRLIQHHRPRYNRRSRDPERYCYLKTTFILCTFTCGFPSGRGHATPEAAPGQGMGGRLRPNLAGPHRHPPGQLREPAAAQPPSGPRLRPADQAGLRLLRAWRPRQQADSAPRHRAWHQRRRPRQGDRGADLRLGRPVLAAGHAPRRRDARRRRRGRGPDHLRPAEPGQLAARSPGDHRVPRRAGSRRVEHALVAHRDVA
jgi:DNA polymerase III epsilon subunit family exonuclease